jgi:hypothetical protein
MTTAARASLSPSHAGSAGVLGRRHRLQMLRPEAGTRAASATPYVIDMPSVWDEIDYSRIDGAVNVDRDVGGIPDTVTGRRLAQRPDSTSVKVALDNF